MKAAEGRKAHVRLAWWPVVAALVAGVAMPWYALTRPPRYRGAVATIEPVARPGGALIVTGLAGGGAKSVGSARSGAVALVWAPDGRRLAYASGPEVWVTDTRGRTRSVYRGPEGSVIFTVQWTRPGKELYLGWFLAGRDSSKALAVDVANGHTRDLGLEAWDFGVSRDGKSLAYVVSTPETAALRLLSLDTGQRRELIPLGRFDGTLLRPRFSPLGDRVYFIVGYRLPEPPDELWRVAVADGSAERVLGGLPWGVHDHCSTPDGRLVIDSGGWGLYLYSPADGTLAPWKPEPVTSPACTPD